MKRLLSAALAAAALAPAGPAAAQSCDDPQSRCGAILDAACISALGAGSMAATSDVDCDAQMGAYRSCLSEVVEACPALLQADPIDVEADRLRELGALGGLIETPETVVEFYNNARVYARRGDALSQRRMLEKAIAGGADAVDLHLGYAALLKAQEGLIGAREIYGDLARRAPDNRAAQFVAATLAPAPQREAALQALVVGDAPFAPAWLELARLVSADRLGAQSLSDKQAELARLEAFDALDKAGKVYGLYLDKDAVDAIRAGAARRLAALRAQNLDIAPVTVTAMASNDSWGVTLNLIEPASAIRYRIDGGAIQETGTLSMLDPQTGKPRPRPYLTLPLGTDQAMIDVWYDDLRGQEQGPFPIAFSAADAFVASAKNVLVDLTRQWIQDRAWDDAQLVYFTHLVSHRCGLSAIAYGVEGAAPSVDFPLTPCDPKNPYAVADGQEIYLRFEPPVSRMSVKLTFRDGAVETRDFTF